MNMRLRLPIALALALGGTHAYALGLGQIEVKSALNQPLVAEIPVLVSSPGEADDLLVRLASPDAFARVGLDRPALQSANLTFDVQTDARGRKVIRITTPTNVADPFLSFLLEADWGKGKMLREYTVLLDPPSMAPITASAPAAVTPVSEPVAAPAVALDEPPAAPVHTPEPVPVAEATAPAAEQEPSPYTAPSSPSYGADTYGPVSGSDTLWAIAQRTRPDSSVSINQMMLALLRANPEAFVGNNINRLKKGAVLRIPGREEAAVVAAAEAAAQVRDQIHSWSGSVATVSQPADATPNAPSSPRPGADSARTDSRLELTPPRSASGDASASESGADADGTGRELRAELARSREESSALQQENLELKSRVDELEDLQGESRRLLELKDSELAAAQRRLAELEAAQASGVEAPAVEAETASGSSEAETLTVSEDALVENASSDAALDAVSEDVTHDEALVSASEPALVAEEVAQQEVAQVAEAAPAPAQPTPAPVAPQESSGMNPLVWGGGAAVVLGLAGWLAARRRRGKVDSKAAVVATAAPAVVAFESTQEEAELVDALLQYPNDLQLHLELLRYYYAQNDVRAFEGAAEAMYTQVIDPNDSAWQEVVGLGRQLVPDNVLFADPDASDSLLDDGLVYGTESESSAVTYEETPTFDSPAQEAVSEEVNWFTSSPTPEFDATTTPVALDDSATSDESMFDISFEEPQSPGDFDDFIESPAVSTASNDFLDSFSNDANDTAIDADAAATKLELARAYLDMGDAEGARGMLEEVLTEGTSDQRNEAQQLLNGIA